MFSLKLTAAAALASAALTLAQLPPFGDAPNGPFFKKNKGVCRDALIGKEFACNADSLDVGMQQEKNTDVFLKFMTQGTAQNSIEERFSSVFPWQNTATEEVFVLVVEVDDEDDEAYDFFETADYYADSGGHGGHGGYGQGASSGRSGKHHRRRKHHGDGPNSDRRGSSRDIVSAGVCACILNDKGSYGPLPPFGNKNSGSDDDFVESPSKFVCFLEEDNIADSKFWDHHGHHGHDHGYGGDFGSAPADSLAPTNGTQAVSGGTTQGSSGYQGSSSSSSGYHHKPKPAPEKEFYDIFGPWDYTSTLSGSVKGSNLRAFSISAVLKDTGIEEALHWHGHDTGLNLPHFQFTPYTRSLLDCTSSDGYGDDDSDFLLPPFGNPFGGGGY